jgi:hypothetical protein
VVVSQAHIGIGLVRPIVEDVGDPGISKGHIVLAHLVLVCLTEIPDGRDPDVIVNQRLYSLALIECSRIKILSEETDLNHNLVHYCISLLLREALSA